MEEDDDENKEEEEEEEWHYQEAILGELVTCLIAMTKYLTKDKAFNLAYSLGESQTTVSGKVEKEQEAADHIVTTVRE